MTDIKWENPPTSRVGKGKHNDFAAALRARPGEWALLSDDTASQTVTAVNTGRTTSFAPRGSFEAQGQSVGPNRSRVWVRYVGAGEGA